MKDIHDYIGKAVVIDGKEGEIQKILGVQFLKVEFFNVNDGDCTIPVEDIEKYLV